MHRITSTRVLIVDIRSETDRKKVGDVLRSKNSVKNNPGLNRRFLISCVVGLYMAFFLPGIGRSCADPAAEWHQAAGPLGNFASPLSAPLDWSVVKNKNIRWRLKLPETGQSTPVISQGRLYFTTFAAVTKDSTLGKDLVAWCCSAKTGRVMWQRKITGKHPLRLSGCFGDSSSPPAVCSDERVVFLNASGRIVCFDLKGREIWTRDVLSVGRTLPFEIDGLYVFTRQQYPPDPDGVFPHKYSDLPKNQWTNLHALDMATGEDVWSSTCGVNMGSAVLPQTLNDGRQVSVVGRGGGHGPPEKPEGISLVDLKTGSTLWTLPLAGFMSTMSYCVRNDEVHIFHRGEHLSIDAIDGTIMRRASIVGDVTLRKWNGVRYVSSVETLKASNKNRMITQTSNLLVGKHHYFRSYTRPWLGRINVTNGTLEYLELPLQLKTTAAVDPELLWYQSPLNGKSTGLNQQSFTSNSMTNSSGFIVSGDKRSRGNGWGHIASPVPSVAGDHLYIPVMNGTVYVVRWNADKLDEHALVGINDLGTAGESWTRASLSFSNRRIYAHTIKELICIEK
jgi:outer membrane protein assembly factor BamB